MSTQTRKPLPPDAPGDERAGAWSAYGPQAHRVTVRDLEEIRDGHVAPDGEPWDDAWDQGWATMPGGC